MHHSRRAGLRKQGYRPMESDSTGGVWSLPVWWLYRHMLAFQVLGIQRLTSQCLTERTPHMICFSFCLTADCQLPSTRLYILLIWSIYCRLSTCQLICTSNRWNRLWFIELHELAGSMVSDTLLQRRHTTSLQTLYLHRCVAKIHSSYHPTFRLKPAR